MSSALRDEERVYRTRPVWEQHTQRRQQDGRVIIRAQLVVVATGRRYAAEQHDDYKRTGDE